MSLVFSSGFYLDDSDAVFVGYDKIKFEFDFLVILVKSHIVCSKRTCHKVLCQCPLVDVNLAVHNAKLHLL